ncbi:hypothetical protein M8C21_023724, partial [Ambrosia artemisiifolia]
MTKENSRVLARLLPPLQSRGVCAPSSTSILFHCLSLVSDDERNETMIICETYKQSIKKCDLKDDVRIQGTSSTIFVLTSNVKHASWTIKPYARNRDKSAMKSVTNFTIKMDSGQGKPMPDCTQTHNVPA